MVQVIGFVMYFCVGEDGLPLKAIRTGCTYYVCIHYLILRQCIRPQPTELTQIPESELLYSIILYIGALVILGFEDLGPIIYMVLLYKIYSQAIRIRQWDLYIRQSYQQYIRMPTQCLLRQLMAIYPSKHPVNSLYNFIKRTF